MAWPRRRAPADASTGLRSQLLELEPADIGLEPTEELPNVWGGRAVCEGDDRRGSLGIPQLPTSMYTSTGGGVIGGGTHDSVVQASRGFLVELEGRLGELEEVKDTGLPAPGIVAFRALTYSGPRARTADESELANGDHALSGLYAAGHGVISALREITEAGV